MQAKVAASQVSAKVLAEDLLALWHHLLRGSSRDLYALLLDLAADGMAHVKTLHMLADCAGELSVKEAGERLGLSLPGASRVVDTLLRRGYLTRREDEHDRRIRRVRISPQGADVVRRIDGARLVGLESFTSSLSAAQRAHLHEALADLPLPRTP